METTAREQSTGAINKISTQRLIELAKLNWDTGEDYYHSARGDKPIHFDGLGETGTRSVLAGMRAVLIDLGFDVPS